MKHTTPGRWRAVAAACALAGGQAAMLALPALTPLAASAQTVYRAQPATATPRVTAFDVRSVDRVVAGAELEFTLWGTPAADASLSIDGSQRVLRLHETSPGVYQGVYVVSSRDRIAPDARVTANLRQGNRVGSALLDETLQRDYTPAAAATGNLPRIDKFTVSHGGERHRAGEPIRLTLLGTPGATVTARLPGASERRIVMREVRAGEYQGTYVVRADDRLRIDEPVVARMRVGDRVVTTRLDNALEHARLQPVLAPPHCADCAVVTAINRVEVDGDGRYIGGTLAGGVLGAVLGSQIGGGDGRTAAGVAGAVGGALIGREIEKRQQRDEVWEVVLRMADGNRQVVTYQDRPDWKVGDAVRLVDGTLRAQRS